MVGRHLQPLQPPQALQLEWQRAVVCVCVCAWSLRQAKSLLCLLLVGGETRRGVGNPDQFSHGCLTGSDQTRYTSTDIDPEQGCGSDCTADRQNVQVRHYCKLDGGEAMHVLTPFSVISPCTSRQPCKTPVHSNTLQCSCFDRCSIDMATT